MQTAFRSKADARFAWIAVAMPGVALLALLTSRPRTALLWIPLGTACLAAVIVCWIFLATYYEVLSEELVAHCGPFTWRIPLREISDIRDSSSTRSGPALSLDRLEIVHGGGKRLIVSPADKAGFVAALRRRMAEPRRTR